MTDTIALGNRGDFGLWAIEIAKQIVSEKGSDLAIAARNGNDEAVRTAANALGQAITGALLEVYDGLRDDSAEKRD